MVDHGPWKQHYRFSWKNFKIGKIKFEKNLIRNLSYKPQHTNVSPRDLVWNNTSHTAELISKLQKKTLK